MEGYLYLITNTTNGKQYVGKTYDSISNRWRDHVNKSKSDINRPLYRAINKYGKDSFTIEEVAKYKEDILEDQEIELIAKLGTFNTGYNATPGGDGRRYSKYSDQELINLYKLVGNTKEIARTHNICATRLQAILRKNNIPLNKDVYKEASLKTSMRLIKLIEHDTYFANLTECANYLIKEGIAKASLKPVKTGIGRVLNGDRKSYLKLTFEEGAAEVAN